MGFGGSRIRGGFYAGTWFIPQYPIPTQQEWLLPLDGDHQHLKETQNVEELEVNPEDMDELPQDIQAGGNQWVTFSFSTADFYVVQGFNSVSVRPGGFYLQDVPGLGGFYLQDIGI